MANEAVFPPIQSLLDKAAASGVDVFDERFAELMDKEDELAHMRSEFHIPRGATGEEAIYLCGNSLGVQPRRTQVYLQEELDKWASSGVEGHFTGTRPWASIDEIVTGLSAEVVGAASSDEVAVMNSLSVNLHLLLTTFYRPTAQRHKMIVEDNAFCSDNHIFASQIRLHGFDPETSLIRVSPRAGCDTLALEDILATIEQHGSETAVICFGGVQFYSGQFFDLPAIVKAGHEKGCYVGFDLAHAAGNVELKLHEWDVDFACWCSYKYLNAGPGSIAAIFVHSRLRTDPNAQSRLAGWWGQEPHVRFQMLPEHQMKLGAQGFQLSNPAVLPVVCLRASLELFHEATIPKLRAKSLLLTGYLELLLRRHIASDTLRILTPCDPNQRGCQLSLSFKFPVEKVHAKIEASGVICDIRRPNVMRIAPTPLYNSFGDVCRFVRIMKRSLEEFQSEQQQQQQQ